MRTQLDALRSEVEGMKKSFATEKLIAERIEVLAPGASNGYQVCLSPYTGLLIHSDRNAHHGDFVRIEPGEIRIGDDAAWNGLGNAGTSIELNTTPALKVTFTADGEVRWAR